MTIATGGRRGIYGIGRATRRRRRGAEGEGRRAGDAMRCVTAMGGGGGGGVWLWLRRAMAMHLLGWRKLSGPYKQRAAR